MQRENVLFHSPLSNSPTPTLVGHMRYPLHYFATPPSKIFIVDSKHPTSNISQFGDLALQCNRAIERYGSVNFQLGFLQERPVGGGGGGENAGERKELWRKGVLIFAIWHVFHLPMRSASFKVDYP